MKYIALYIFVFFNSNQIFSQSFGMSSSFFIPKNGYFSTPISPLSVRGISLARRHVFSIDIGGSLYRMSGMGIKGAPISPSKPIVGPCFTIMIPLELIIQLKTKHSSFKLKGGGFSFYNFDTKLNYGNIDQAMIDYLKFEIANSEFTFDNKIGYGYEFGVEIIQYLTKKIGVTVGFNYYVGESKLNLKGIVKGVNSAGLIEVSSIDFSESALDYTGLEISIGVLFNSKRNN